MGIGDWGLGIGDWGLGIGPNPQSPIPNPQSPIPISNIYNLNKILIYHDKIKSKNLFNFNRKIRDFSYFYFDYSILKLFVLHFLILLYAVLYNLLKNYQKIF